MELQLSLHNIETGLRELFADRQEAMEKEDYDQVVVINAGIQKYVEAEIRKVDNIADFVTHLDGLNESIDEEIDRLRERKKKFAGIVANIKDTCKFVMQGMPWKEGKPRKIEGVRHTISLRGNGGKQAVVVTDESLVPDELCDVTIKMPADAWFMICGQIDRRDVWLNAVRTPSLSRISDELNKPCIQCGGGGTRQVYYSTNTLEQIETCPECSGTGRVSVPGARLEERGESVHIS